MARGIRLPGYRVDKAGKVQKVDKVPPHVKARRQRVKDKVSGVKRGPKVGEP